MIRTIIKQLLPDLQTINFTDLVCGIVTSGVKNIIIDNENIGKKVFPMYETDPTLCDNSDYVLCVPDEKYRSIIYFEEIGNTIISQTNYEIKMSSDVRLVSWFNTKKIGNISSAVLMGLILQSIHNFNFTNTTNLNNIKITLSGVEKKSATIFSGYTYDESETQYLIFPYDYGSLTFTVTYSVNLCIDDIELNPNCGIKIS